MALTNLGSPAPSAGPAALPTLSVSGPAALAEGEGGSTLFAFTVTRQGDASRAVSCRWSVAPAGTAPATPGDFVGGVLPSGSLTLAAGEVTGTITVAITGDAVAEADEAFTLTLADATMAVAIDAASATGTILNDDAAPAVTARVLAANRTDLPTASVNFGQNTTARRLHHASPQGAISNLRTVDVGFYLNSAEGGPSNVPAAFTIKRYIEYPAGTYTAVTWGGIATVSIAPGAVVTSDPVAVSVPAGAAFFERTVIVSPPSGAIPTIQLPAGSSSLGLPDGKALADMGNGGSIAADNSVNSFGACAILGDIANPSARAFLVIGDSIAFGQGDTSSAGPRGGSGWIGRWLDPLVPYAKIAVPGQGAAAMAGLCATAQIVALLGALGYTDVIEEHGINDLRLARSEVQLLADLQTLWSQHPGRRVFQTTLTPRAASTNGYADVAGQVTKTDGSMTLLATVNAAIRARPAGIAGVIEAADAAMSARDSAVWGGPFPPVEDGTHPTSAKAAAMAAAMAPTTIGL